MTISISPKQMVEFYIQSAQKILVLTVLLVLSYGVQAQSRCDSLEAIYQGDPDIIEEGSKIGWSYDLSEPSEPLKKFLKRKSKIEKVNYKDWQVFCKPGRVEFHVRISFFVTTGGKPVCVTASDTTCGELAQRAVAFISETEFSPATKNRRTVVHKSSYPFTFRPVVVQE